MRDVFRGDNRVEVTREVQGAQHHLDVESRRRRGDRLPPAVPLKPFQPVGCARQRRQAVSLGQPAVLGLLGLGDPRDALVRGIGPQPDAQDAVVALPETGFELIEGDIDAIGLERELPRLPMERFGVDERAVEIPEDRAAHF